MSAEGQQHQSGDVRSAMALGSKAAGTYTGANGRDVPEAAADVFSTAAS